MCEKKVTPTGIGRGGAEKEFIDIKRGRRQMGTDLRYGVRMLRKHKIPR